MSHEPWATTMTNKRRAMIPSIDKVLNERNNEERYNEEQEQDNKEQYNEEQDNVEQDCMEWVRNNERDDQ